MNEGGEWMIEWMNGVEEYNINEWMQEENEWMKYRLKPPLHRSKGSKSGKMEWWGGGVRTAGS